MSRSPIDLLTKHKFKDKMAIYIKEVEKYIDNQMDINYDEFLNNAKIKIKCNAINEVIFNNRKKLPSLIETYLEIELLKLYPDWDVSIQYPDSDGSIFIFSLRQGIVKEGKKEEVSSSKIENRSELLDLGGK